MDNYVSTFQSVLILQLFEVPPEIMARLLQRSLYLIREHLNLVRKLYPSTSQLRQYLREQGVKI